ncbi:BMP family ABC transporter substrate-binding protein [Bacillus shivajii]|uniref:BMP family lipoprotein n=1 Tax=Bacillus shivajii TaxID=1983719 RepID=UPI001CFA3785|nr:BMP family ABC transporter substrate-binding protein [Bacillus shivajii]UCZ54174.1 BMP family ABC transporter substrate-binding protein [Bacillus shivajii]
MKKRFMMLVSSVLAAGTLLAACGEAEDDADQTPVGGDDEVTEETGDFSAKMVTDTGGVDDRSFNESAWDGLQQFEEDYDVEVDYIQSNDASDYMPNLNRLAREGTSISFAIGFLMEDDIRTVAEQNPEQHFAIVDTVVEGADGSLVPNIANITFAEHEGSFLVGVVAAMQTETDHVGFIGGVESPLIKKFENGFKAGVKTVNPDIEISVQYAQDFNDASRGQQIADTLYGNGADVIYHAAGGTGNGLFTEAIDRARGGENVWVIGVDQDQHAQGEYSDGNVTLTSMVKRVDQAVYQVAEQTMNGDYPGGEILEFGLEEQGVGIAETTDNVSEEALEAVEDYIEQIMNGDIDVPETDDAYDDFLGSL